MDRLSRFGSGPEAESPAASSGAERVRASTRKSSAVGDVPGAAEPRLLAGEELCNLAVSCGVLFPEVGVGWLQRRRWRSAGCPGPGCRPAAPEKVPRRLGINPD